jgi:hypothetical protein
VQHHPPPLALVALTAALLAAGCDDNTYKYQQERIAALEGHVAQARDEAQRLHSLNNQLLASQRETIAQLEIERARGQAQGEEAKSGRNVASLMTTGLVVLGCGFAAVVVARRRARVPGTP